MRAIYFTSLFLLFVSISFGQSNQELIKVMEALNGQLTEVETKSSNFTQVFEWDEKLPYKVKLIITETSRKKGKVKQSTYSFSLKDIDVNTVRSRAKKDVIEVGVYMKSKQKLVIYSKEGKFEKYVSNFIIVAQDPDFGKEIEAALKNAAEKAKSFTSSCPANVQEAYKWLSDNMTDFSVEDNSVEQSFSLKGSIVNYSVTTKGKKGKVEHYLFNLADLNEKSLKLEIKNTDFYISAKTSRSKKYIFYTKEEAKSSYINKVNFYIADFDKAKCLLSVLELVIEDSEKKEKDNQVSFGSASEALTELSKLTASVETEKVKIAQELKSDCSTILESTIKKGKSDPKQNEFKFNFLDIKAKDVEIDISGNQVSIELSTSKNKLIQVSKDGGMGSYTNKISIVAPDIETAKIMKIAAMEAAEHCKTEIGFKGFSTVSENFSWIEKSLKEHTVPNLEQSLELIDKKECKWKFTSIKTGKKPLEEIFEFNLEDLSKKRVKWNVSSKKLAIEVNTKRKEKNIKYYKNGEPGNYRASFSIEFDDIEAARNAIMVMKQAIKSCDK